MNSSVRDHESLVGILDRFEVGIKTLMTTEDGLHGQEDRPELEVGGGQRKERFHVASVICSIPAPHDLHVLLRHRPRSIPQAQESEGASCSDSPRSPSARLRSQYVTSLVTLPLRTTTRFATSACIRPRSSPLVLPRPLNRIEDEYAAIVEFAVLVHRHAQVLPDAEDFSPSFCHPGNARPSPGSGPVGSYELDLRVGPTDRTEVAALPRLVDRSHHLHVLLRHRPRSIPRLRSRRERLAPTAPRLRGLRAGSAYISIRADLPSRMVQTWPKAMSTGSPLVFDRPRWRTIVTTLSPASWSASTSSSQSSQPRASRA